MSQYYRWDKAQDVVYPITTDGLATAFMVDRKVASDTIIIPGGMKLLISTSFLVIDHNSSDGGVPILFETLVFANEDYGTELYCKRYATSQEAREWHERIMRRFNDAERFLTEHPKSDIKDWKKARFPQEAEEEDIPQEP